MKPWTWWQVSKLLHSNAAIKAPIDPRFDPRHAAQLYPRAQPPGAFGIQSGLSAGLSTEIYSFLKKTIHIHPHIIIHTYNYNIYIYPVPVGCTVSKLCIHPARVNMTCASCAMNKPHPQSLQRVRYLTYPDHLTWIAILHRSAMFEHEVKSRDI